MKRYIIFKPFFLYLVLIFTINASTTVIYNVNQCIIGDGSQANCENFGINSAGELTNWDTSSAAHVELGKVTKKSTVAIPFTHTFNKFMYSFTPTAGIKKSVTRVLFVVIPEGQEQAAGLSESVMQDLKKIQSKVTIKKPYSIVKVYRRFGKTNTKLSEWTDVADFVVPRQTSSGTVELTSDGIATIQTTDETGNKQTIVINLCKTY